jgi:hypothetical protein
MNPKATENKFYYIDLPEEKEKEKQTDYFSFSPLIENDRKKAINLYSNNKEY